MAKSPYREYGAILVDGTQVGSSMQCVHCGVHWITQPGSGRVRGFCRCCMGPTCGAVGCDACVPFEKKLDLYEKGLIKTL